MSLIDQYRHLKEKLVGKEVEIDQTLQDFYLTFSPIHGRRVLVKILTDLCFFDIAITDEQVALSNYARRLLVDMGVFREENINNIVKDFIKFPETIIKTKGVENEKV